MLCCCFVGVDVFGLAGLELLLRLLLTASDDILVLKPLPFIKLWHTFSVLS
jgi:hypothetical protein